jgi:exopolysaccharide production protein ExoQ
MNFITARIERLATFVFLLIVAGVFWPPNVYLTNDHLSHQGGSNIFDSSAFAALAVFLIVAFAARWQETLRLLRCAWPVLALVGLAFVSAYWSEDPWLVIRRSGTVTISSLFGVYLIGRSDFADLVALLVKVYAAAMAASLVVIAAAPSVAIGGNETYVDAWRGVFSDKNELGLGCALTVIFSSYALYRGYGPRWLAAAAIAMALVAFKLAESKTPLVDMMAAAYVAVFAAMLRRRSGFGLLAGFTLGVLGLAGVVVFALDSAAILEAIGRDPTFTNRAKIWHYAWIYIERHEWLGYGFGSFWRVDGVEANEAWRLIGFMTPHAHNAWLEVGLGLGLAGMGLIALNWLAVFYRAARMMTAPAARHVVFCMAMLIAIFLENMTEYEFFRANAMLWVLFVAITTYLGRAAMVARAARPPYRVPIAKPLERLSPRALTP